MVKTRKNSKTLFYQVDRIGGSRTVNKSKQFLVYWKGYPDSEATWEYKRSMGCPELIADYEAKCKSTASLKKASTNKLKLTSTIAGNKIAKKVDKVKEIINADVLGKNKIMITYITMDGSKKTCLSKELHESNPIALLNYYEQHIVNDDE